MVHLEVRIAEKAALAMVLSSKRFGLTFNYKESRSTIIFANFLYALTAIRISDSMYPQY